MPLIAMTGRRAIDARASAADVHLDVSVAEEACPLNLAPTASTTATLAMGDALAIALLEARGFTERGLRALASRRQPRPRLLLHVDDVMRTRRRVPRGRPGRAAARGLLEMTRKGLGMTAMVDAERRVLGIFTDGDLRRALDDDDSTCARDAMRELMTANPKTIAPTGSPPKPCT